MYCGSCKKYEEVDYDPIENINKFMEFIKEEQRKINPEPKKVKVPRHPEMADDSVSEITDLEK